MRTNYPGWRDNRREEDRDYGLNRNRRRESFGNQRDDEHVYRNQSNRYENDRGYRNYDDHRDYSEFNDRNANFRNEGGYPDRNFENERNFRDINPQSARQFKNDRDFDQYDSNYQRRFSDNQFRQEDTYGQDYGFERDQIDRDYRSNRYGSRNQDYGSTRTNYGNIGRDRDYYNDDPRSNPRGTVMGRMNGPTEYDRSGMQSTTGNFYGSEERNYGVGRQSQQSFRGKGPKGYERSDSRIKDDLNDAFADHSSLDPSDIEISVSSGTVVLKGMVDSKWAKRASEDLAESVSGVKNVENHIHVKSQSKDSSSTTGKSSSSQSSAISRDNDSSEKQKSSTANSSNNGGKSKSPMV